MHKRYPTYRGLIVRHLKDGSTVWDVVISRSGTRRKICGFRTRREAIAIWHRVKAAQRQDRLSFLTIPSDGDR